MLTVITGPMFAGKSSALISKGISHIIAGDTVIAFKPCIDDRYSSQDITTHYGDKFPGFALSKHSTIRECKKYMNEYNPDVILFDEAQFFDRDIIMTLICDFMQSYHVIVAGLAQDSYGHEFGAMPILLSYADNIVCLKAVCSKCKKVNSATRTYRKTKDKSQVVVGGIDAFEPRCFECWIK